MPEESIRDTLLVRTMVNPQPPTGLTPIEHTPDVLTDILSLHAPCPIDRATTTHTVGHTHTTPKLNYDPNSHHNSGGSTTAREGVGASALFIAPLALS